MSDVIWLFVVFAFLLIDESKAKHTKNLKWEE
jgi:hypothetical protein